MTYIDITSDAMRFGKFKVLHGSYAFTENVLEPSTDADAAYWVKLAGDDDTTWQDYPAVDPADALQQAKQAHIDCDGDDDWLPVFDEAIESALSEIRKHD